MGGEEEGKKNNNKQHDDHSDIVVLCYFYILCNVSETVRRGGSGRLLSVRSHLAVSSAVCSNLRTRSQAQAQAGATEGLIVKVRFNKTVRFSLGGGGGGVRGGWTEWRPPEERRKTEARGVSSRMKAEQAQQIEMFTELSTPKMLSICAAAARSDRSPSQLCSQLQQVCCRASCERPGKLRCTSPNREYTPRALFFDSSRVGLAHGRTCRETWKQSKKIRSFFFFFPRQSDLVRGLIRRTSACFYAAGGETIGKQQKIEAILGKRGRSWALPLHLQHI